MRPMPRTALPARRGGTVTVWLVVCLGVIIGIVALGLDGGRMMEERRHAQAAADAAALAAGNDLYMNYRVNRGADPDGSAQAAALASAQANGYANDGSSSQVEVNIPPKSGTFIGKAGYVEVIVHSNLPGTFSALFTSGPLPVKGRAVARGQPQIIGLLLLSSGTDALAVSGNASVQVTSASIQTNSTSASAYDLTGNASVSAVANDVAGSTAPSGNVSGPVNTSVPPVPDPLLSLPVPALSAYPVQATSQTAITSGAVSLQPGIYQGGISIGGSAAVTLAPGVYITTGGFQISGQATVIGNGVMIYNAGDSSAGPVSIGGGGSISLTPPTSGTYQGICIFQDRTLTQPIQISGTGSIQVSGIIYAPAATVEITGNGSTTANTLGGVVASAVQVSGNGTLTVSQGGTYPRVPDVGLVE